MQTTEVHRYHNALWPSCVRSQDSKNKRWSPCGHGNLKETFQTTTWHFLMSSCWLKFTLEYGQQKTTPLSIGKAFKPILKEINPKYSLEGLMLKLKLQHSGHLMRTVNSLKKTLMLGRNEGRIRGHQRMRWLDSVTDSADVNLSKLWAVVEDRGAWHATVHGVSESQT